jgi:hypothetical protein
VYHLRTPRARGTIHSMYGYHFHTDGAIKAERDTLSYSGIDLWRKNKEQYRARYYENKGSFTSPFTVFGTEVHRKVEEGLITLPEHATEDYVHEVHILATIDGIKVQGYIDLLHKTTHSVTDLKTSINPWDSSMVQKLDQLPLYTLLLREHHDKVSLWVKLVWLETAWETTSKGLAETRTLTLTGNSKVFKRRLYLHDLDRVRGLIISTARDVAEDFELWKKTTKTSTLAS